MRVLLNISAVDKNLVNAKGIPPANKIYIHDPLFLIHHGARTGRLYDIICTLCTFR